MQRDVRAKQNVDALLIVVIALMSRHHLTVEFKFKCHASNQTSEQLAPFEYACHIYRVFPVILQGAPYSFFFFHKILVDKCLALTAYIWIQALPFASFNYRRCCFPFIHLFPLVLQGHWGDGSFPSGKDWPNHQLTRGPQRDKQLSTLIFTTTYNVESSRVSLMFMSLDSGEETGASIQRTCSRGR